MNFKPLTRVDFICVHCSATPADRNIGAADIRQWHRAKGWRDIGYHFVIRRDGTLEAGRPTNQPGAHEPRINARSLAICLVGGSPPIASPAYKKGLGEDNFTPEQMETLRVKVSELKKLHPNAEVLGHRDVPGVKKACPSFDVRAWWSAAEVEPAAPRCT